MAQASGETPSMSDVLAEEFGFDNRPLSFSDEGGFSQSPFTEMPAGKATKKKEEKK
jgi:hypothetical protein